MDYPEIIQFAKEVEDLCETIVCDVDLQLAYDRARIVNFILATGHQTEVRTKARGDGIIES